MNPFLSALLYLQLYLSLVFMSFSSAAVRFVTEVMSPFQISEGTQLSGFAVEVIEEIKQKTGIRGKIEVYPWAKSYNIALNEADVFIFTLVKTDERLTRFQWIDEYHTATDSFYALKSRTDIKIRSMADAKRYVTCIPRNDVGEQRLMKLGFSEKHLKKVAFQAQCLGMLYRDRVDLNLFNHHGIQNLSKKFDVDPDQFRRVFVVSKAVMGIAASKRTSSVLVNKVRKALTEIKQSRRHQQRIHKWFRSDRKNKPRGKSSN